MMDGYVIKCAGSGLSLILNHGLNLNNSQRFDYLDPFTTMVKLHLIGYKKLGTKLGISNHTLMIQEFSLLQGIRRFFHGDDRNQLHQVRWPLLYFHGIVLGHVSDTSSNQFLKFYKFLEEKAIIGLKRLKLTYGSINEPSSMIINCIDDYIHLLSHDYNLEDYNKLTYDMTTSMITPVYQEYMKNWTLEEIGIIERLSQSLEKRCDQKLQNDLCNIIDSYLVAKNREISSRRPI